MSILLRLSSVRRPSLPPGGGGDPDPPAGFTQAGTFESFVSGTGSRLVSSAVLFPPGVMAADNLDNFRITVSGVEQAIYVEDHGVWRHPDGTLRAVLVQTQQTLTFGTPLAMQIEVGTARNKANDLTKTSISFDQNGADTYKDANPEAVCNFPKEYLCTCRPWTNYDLRWRGITDGLEEDYDDNLFTDFDLFTITGGTNVAQEGGFNLDTYTAGPPCMYKKWGGEASGHPYAQPFLQYDIGFIHFNYWLMTGDVKHLRAGMNYASLDCYEYYAAPVNIASHMLAPMMYMATWLIGGDDGLKTKLHAIANHHFSVGAAPGGGHSDFEAELRPFAFRLLTGYACHMSGITASDWKARTETYFTAWDNDPDCWIESGPEIGGYWLKLMYNTCSPPLADDANVVHNFFVPITCASVVEYEDVYQVSLPSNIDDRVTGLLEYLRNTQYRDDGGGSGCATPDFQYQPNDLAVSCPNNFQAGTSPGHHNLNGLYAGAFRMAGKFRNNANWKALGEIMLETMQRRTHRSCDSVGHGPYYYAPRTLHECYRWFHAAYSLRG